MRWESLPSKANLAFNVLILVALASSSSSSSSCFSAGATSTSNNVGVRGGLVGLQHRDFDAELAPNLSSEERLESAVRRSHARMARIEAMLSRAREIAPNGGGARAGEASGKGRGGGVASKEASEGGDGAKVEEAGARFGGGEEAKYGGDGYSAEVEAEDGAFLTSVQMGTPARRVRMILDTGSDLVWQQCQPCVSCFAQRDPPVFDPARSSSFRRAPCSHPLCRQLLQVSSSSSAAASPSSAAPCARQPNASCAFTYMYGDTSYTSGDLAFDTLTLLDPRGQAFVHVENFAFGCGHVNRGASFVGSDGILGMGQGPLSLPSQLSSPSFSYCLTPLEISRSSALLLGDHAAAFLHTDQGSQAQVTSIVTNKLIPSFYYLNLTGISVDGVRLAISLKTFSLKANGSGGMIIDSGTTITYLQEHGYNIVRRAIQSRVNRPLQISPRLFGLDLCFVSLNEAILPTLTFHFDGANMEIPPSNLFVHVGGIYCLAMSRSYDVSILGNVQQQNYQMLYDRSKQEFSFIRTSCEQDLT